MVAKKKSNSAKVHVDLHTPCNNIHTLHSLLYESKIKDMAAAKSSLIIQKVAFVLFLKDIARQTLNSEGYRSIAKSLSQKTLSLTYQY